MKLIKIHNVFGVFALLTVFFHNGVSAQNGQNLKILSDSETARVAPASFYFSGQSAPTQLRNTSAARLGQNRLVIAGLVDTSGYSTEISGRYEGFFITDSPVRVGGRTLATGAYGFGFSKNGTMSIFDIGGRRILTAVTRTDSMMSRPRPIQMTSGKSAIRFYKGRNFVLISPR